MSSQSVERVGDVYALKLELATEKQRRQLLDEHLRAAEERLAATTSNGAALQRLQQDYKLLHAQNEEALAELAATADDRNSLLKAHNDAVVKVESLSNQLKTANRELQHSQQEAAKARNDYAELERKYAASRRDNSEAQRTADELTQRLGRELQDSHRIRGVEVLVHQEVCSRQALLALQEDYRHRVVASALKESRASVAQLTRDAISFEEQKNSFYDSVQELHARTASLVQAHAECEPQKEFFRAELAAQATVIKDLRETLGSLSRTQVASSDDSAPHHHHINTSSSVDLRLRSDLQQTRQLLDKSMKELDDERANNIRRRCALEEQRLEQPVAKIVQDGELAALRHAFALARQQIVQQQDQEAKLSAHYKQVSDECRLLHAEAEVFAATNAEQQRIIRQLESNVADLSNANTALTDDKRRFSEAIKTLEQRVEEVAHGSSAGVDDPLLKAKYSVLASEVDSYKEVIGRLQDHLRAVETDRVPLLVHKQHMHHFEVQIADLEKRVAVLQQRNQNEAQRCQKLQAELDAKEEENQRLAPQHEMRRRLDFLQKEVDLSTARLAEAEAQRVNLQKRVDDAHSHSQATADLLHEKDRIVEGVAKQLLEAATEIESLTRERDEYRRMIEQHRERDKRDALFTLHRASSQQSSTPLPANTRRLF